MLARRARCSNIVKKVTSFRGLIYDSVDQNRIHENVSTVHNLRYGVNDSAPHKMIDNALKTQDPTPVVLIMRSFCS